MKIILYNDLTLNRNISGFNFPSKLDKAGAEKIIEDLKKILIDKGFKFYRTKDLSSLEKLNFYENNHLTATALKNADISGVFINDDNLAVRVNGQNHIEIHKTDYNASLLDIYEEVNKLDDYMDGKVQYAFRDDFGYLTSDINYCGNGLIAKVYLHLPAIDYFNDISVISTLERLGYSMKKISHGRKKSAAIYCLSLDRTIGIDEKSYLDKILNITREIEDIENQKRQKLYLDKIIDLEDLVNRAYGILRNCRMIEEEEMIDKMSDLFLGIELSILKPKKEIDLAQTINKFKNGHLQVEREALLDEKSRNILRANNIRKMMKEVFWTWMFLKDLQIKHKNLYC